MIISFTGHRLNKLGYQLPNPTYNYVCQQLEQHLLRLQPDKCISGMALGFDQFAANVCVKLGIPFIAAIPHVGQENIWPEKSQRIYRCLLDKAAEVVIVSEGGYSAHKMQVRNEYLCDQCDTLIACFDGSKGGTSNCLDYAHSIGRQIIVIDPRLASP